MIKINGKETIVVAVGERIKSIRIKQGMTQKYLGMSVGFDENTADVRLAQYESGTRSPKKNLLNNLANALSVSPLALDVPNIDSYHSLIHTLFALEDIYGFSIEDFGGEPTISIKQSIEDSHTIIWNMLNEWYRASELLKSEKITRDEYDEWRYNYPLISLDQDEDSVIITS